MPNKSLIKKLRKSGYRITKAREAIIDQFASAHIPSTAQTIQKTLIAQGIKVNKTTVHREIQFLLSQQIIKPLSLKPRIRHYELNSDHHHHLVCKNCQQIQKISCPEVESQFQDLSNQIKAQSHFQIQQHQLEFYGLCQHCQPVKI